MKKKVTNHDLIWDITWETLLRENPDGRWDLYSLVPWRENEYDYKEVCIVACELLQCTNPLRVL